MSSDLSVILPLVGGFWLVLRCQLLYLISLQLGQAVVVLLSAFVACGLAILSRLVILLLVWLGWQSGLQHLAYLVWPVPFAGTALGAFILAIPLGEMLTWAMGTEWVNDWVTENFASETIRLLRYSMVQLQPVSLTLDTRKVYVGFVQEIPSLNPNKAFVRLLPIMSGCRTQEDMTIKFTTTYGAALRAAADEHGSVSDFVIVIPLATIKTANLFDRSMHVQFFAPEPEGQVRID